MNTKRFTMYLVFFMQLLSGAIVSCQKDDDVKAAEPVAKFAADSTAGNYLATKGTLKLTILDSTYSFDAASDSIAFVNVKTDNGQYFGITAINKAHTMSFGVSSAGYPQGSVVSKLAGSQFLYKDNKIDSAYSLTQYPNLQDTGKITLTSYKQDSVLATGSFYTYLSRNSKTAPEFYKVKGTFSLKIK